MSQPDDDRREGRAVVLADRVVGVRVAQRERRQIAEHVLLQGKARGVRFVVPLDAVDERGGIGGLVVHELCGAGFLLALVLYLARLAEHVDRCAAHLVDEVVRLEREILGDLLPHQRRFTGDVHSAAAVLAPENVGPIIREHVRASRARQQHRRDRGDSSDEALGGLRAHQLQPQPPPACCRIGPTSCWPSRTLLRRTRRSAWRARHLFPTFR